MFCAELTDPLCLVLHFVCRRKMTLKYQEILAKSTLHSKIPLQFLQSYVIVLIALELSFFVLHVFIVPRDHNALETFVCKFGKSKSGQESFVSCTERKLSSDSSAIVLLASQLCRGIVLG